METGSFLSTARGILDDVVELFKAESRLARAEAAEKVAQVQRGMVWVVVGMAVLAIAAFVLAQALIDWFALAIGTPLATLLVGGALLAAALVFAVLARRRLSVGTLAPRRAIAAAQRSAEQIRRAVVGRPAPVATGESGAAHSAGTPGVRPAGPAAQDPEPVTDRAAGTDRDRTTTAAH